ncbi:DNA alkylation repair protein [Elysia marginata]|uniref:DNA alkylation repair protein n=1 Tax=Elysia marginata TaxID=1093978 RepID=A0AAV4HKL2_9GAST|nr:DNA alkylation repair protein [Elysia marginata]
MAEKVCQKPDAHFGMINLRKRKNGCMQNVKEKNITCKVKLAEGSSKPKRSRKDIQQNQNKKDGPAALDDEELLKRFSIRKEQLKRSLVAGSTQVFRKLCDSFERSRDSTKADAMSKYLRFKFEFFGIQTPQRREIYKPLWKEIKLLNSSDLRTLVCEAWYSPEREFQQFAVDLFEKEYLRIYSDDRLSTEKYATSTLDFARQFLACSKSWWDTVDPLAYKVVGPLVKKYPEHLLPVMDRWNVSEITWLVRTSIIYQLGYEKETDAQRLFRYCLKVAHEDEFFIQKAIGWALRQHCRVDEKSVKVFVEKHKKTLSALSVREALKHVK